MNHNHTIKNSVFEINPGSVLLLFLAFHVIIMCMQIAKIFNFGKFRDKISSLVLENNEAFYECKASYLSVFPDIFKQTLKRREIIVR